MCESDDLELLTRFRGGDDSALDPLFERYEGPVFRFLFGILKNHHAAEDATQDTFVQALRHADGTNNCARLVTISKHSEGQCLVGQPSKKPAVMSVAGSLKLIEPTNLVGV